VQESLPLVVQPVGMKPYPSLYICHHSLASSAVEGLVSGSFFQ
jgi:hypothetical protein